MSRGPFGRCSPAGLVGAFARPNWQERPTSDKPDRSAVELRAPRLLPRKLGARWPFAVRVLFVAAPGAVMTPTLLD